MIRIMWVARMEYKIMKYLRTQFFFFFGGGGEGGSLPITHRKKYSLTYLIELVLIVTILNLFSHLICMCRSSL